VEILEAAGSGKMKYTVSELNRMRRAIGGMYPYGVAYYPNERSADIERRLTTYMANGTTAEELEQERKDMQKAQIIREQEIVRIMNERHPAPKPTMTLEEFDEAMSTYRRKKEKANE